MVFPRILDIISYLNEAYIERGFTMIKQLKTTILGDYVKIVSIDLKTSEETSRKIDVKKNEDKLLNNLIRAKNKIIDIGLANDFKYYFTLTFKPFFDRYDLHSVYSCFTATIRRMRDLCGHNIRYLIVPEQHKDGAWHFHGFFMEDIEDFIIINEHGHLDVDVLNRNGFVNIQFIKDKVRISHYIVKYMAKNLGKDISLNHHCYYASLGFKKGVEDIELLYDNEGFNNSYFDFKTDYCAKKIITLEEYNKIRPFLMKL